MQVGIEFAGMSRNQAQNAGARLTVAVRVMELREKSHFLSAGSRLIGNRTVLGKSLFGCQ